MSLENRLDESLKFVDDILQDEVCLYFLNYKGKKILVNNKTKKIIQIYLKKGYLDNIKSVLELYLGVLVLKVEEKYVNESYRVYEFELNNENMLKLSDKYCYIDM